MTAKQFQKALKALGLTPQQAAEHLGVDVRTVRRWRFGTTPVPVPVALLVEAWLTQPGGRGAFKPTAAKATA